MRSYKMHRMKSHGSDWFPLLSDVFFQRMFRRREPRRGFEKELELDMERAEDAEARAFPYRRALTPLEGRLRSEVNAKWSEFLHSSASIQGESLRCLASE